MKWRHSSSDNSLLVVLASPSDKSIHEKVLVQFEEYWTKNNISFSSIDIRDLRSLPFVPSMFVEAPESIKELDKEIKRHKNVIFFTPEYIAHFCAFFKNVLDWLCLIPETKFFQNKGLYIFCVSTTQKLVRTGEKGVWNTMFPLGAKRYTYINFNRFVDGKDESERVEEITKQILSSLVK